MALKALTRLTIRMPRITESTLAILNNIIVNGGAFKNPNNLR